MVLLVLLLIFPNIPPDKVHVCCELSLMIISSLSFLSFNQSFTACSSLLLSIESKSLDIQTDTFGSSFGKKRNALKHTFVSTNTISMSPNCAILSIISLDSL